MSIKSELKKHIGNGIEIDFPSAGLIFGNGVKGIITRMIEPHFVEIDYCDSGNKKQVVNINTINTYGILDEGKIQELRDYYT